MNVNPFSRKEPVRRRERGEQEYWLSYSDLMAGLLMVFVLMLLVAIARYNEQADSLADVRERVTETIRTMAVRDSIIRDLRRLGNETIVVDTVTAAVRMSDAVLFDQDQYVLKPEGERVLGVFAEQYIPVVMNNGRYRDHLREIAIEGHTNDDGSYDYNMGLSQRRAYAVMEYFLQVTRDPAAREFLERYLTARGRSYSRVICRNREVGPAFPEDCPTGVDKAASRRIEIQFRLDDEEVVREVKSLMGS